LEPVFLVRFRSRQRRVRVEGVRAYAWPSLALAMRHLGYRAEGERLLRIEARQPVPFPNRVYGLFQNEPARLEQLRLADKAYQKALQQAGSKPGRAEMELVPLEPAFRQLGDDVA